jgi:hypothetical protein
MAAALVTTRRFPPPWSVDEYNDACFIVRDHDGQQLAYIYFEDEPGRRSAAKLLSKDEARRIAVSFAKLSDLLAALPRLIVNNMARGVYLIGSKLAQRVRAVQIVDCAGNSTTLRLKDYMSQKIEPEYKTLPWQQDVAVLLSTNEKPKK